VIQGVRHGESRRTPVPLGLASHQAVGHGVRTTFVPQNYPLFLNLLRVVILSWPDLQFRPKLAANISWGSG
jgi:hypothetical protein